MVYYKEVFEGLSKDRDFNDYNEKRLLNSLKGDDVKNIADNIIEYFFYTYSIFDLTTLFMPYPFKISLSIAIDIYFNSNESIYTKNNTLKLMFANIIINKEKNITSNDLLEAYIKLNNNDFINAIFFLFDFVDVDDINNYEYPEISKFLKDERVQKSMKLFDTLITNTQN